MKPAKYLLYIVCLSCISLLTACGGGGSSSGSSPSTSSATVISSISSASIASSTQPSSTTSTSVSSTPASSASISSAHSSIPGSVSSSASLSSQSSVNSSVDNLVNIPLQSTITKVQPMTGIVLWADSYNGTALKTDDQYIQLEYAYVRPSDVVTGDKIYNWTAVDTLLEQISARGKQAILRWYYVYPGRVTAVPSYIKSRSDYHETTGITEGQLTHFPDWSNTTLQQATLDFYSAFATRYDHDPRIAFLQVGFGLWGEYHIYEPGENLGVNFPTKVYQKTFLQHLSNVFDELHWSISIDAGDSSNSPIATDASLLALNFGNFDDSFMHKEHADYNKSMWTVFGYAQRYKHSPHGGELSYYSDFDQQNALNPAGMYGRTYEKLSADFHITYMIGNDQPEYQSNERIKQAGMANGYKFRITEFKASSSRSRVSVTNRGIAPIYYDAFITINGVRAPQSLKGLLPDQSMTVDINSGGTQPVLTIESDRLVNGQRIQFEANL